MGGGGGKGEDLPLRKRGVENVLVMLKDGGGGGGTKSSDQRFSHFLSFHK